ncbi:MAG: carbon-nitrogen hydrolase family protein [Paracoccaceae bacterium]
MKIAAAAYPLSWFDAFADYEAKLTEWVAEAAGAGAELLVFPEYGAMELASLGGPAVAADQEGALREAARHRAAADALHQLLAARFRVMILGASGPVFDPACHPDRPVNRASLFGPSGLIGYQDKVMMTRFEREEWLVVPGQSLALFETALGKIGVSICYDSEFPLLGRTLAEAGCEVMLVPSATEGVAGYTRVRVGAMARALEGQMVTVQAPVVGTSPWCAGMEENTGRAAIYGPADHGFPADGILAEGPLGSPGWVYGQADLAAIDALRRDGGVLTRAHWPEQLGPAADLRRISAL